MARPPSLGSLDPTPRFPGPVPAWPGEPGGVGQVAVPLQPSRPLPTALGTAVPSPELALGALIVRCQLGRVHPEALGEMGQSLSAETNQVVLNLADVRPRVFGLGQLLLRKPPARPQPPQVRADHAAAPFMTPVTYSKHRQIWMGC